MPIDVRDRPAAPATVAPRSRARRATPQRTGPAAGGADRILAIDLGGTKVETALVGDDGRVVPGSRRRRETGASRTPESMAEALRDAIAESLAAADGPVIAVGVGSAGPIDLTLGTVSPHNLPLLRGYPIVEIVQGITGLPVSLRLDGTCLALAEHWLGAAQGSAASMSIVVSTGVGGGIVVDGRMLSGASGNAGHIGQMHVAVRREGPPERSTLEAVASGPATVRWARRHGWRGQTGEELAAAVAHGDTVAEAATRRSARFVGQAIASAATLLDLDRVVLGGGFVNVRDDYLDIARDAAEHNAIFDYARRVEVRPSGLDGEGPLLGAAALHFRAALLGGTAG